MKSGIFVPEDAGQDRVTRFTGDRKKEVIALESARNQYLQTYKFAAGDIVVRDQELTDFPLPMSGQPAIVMEVLGAPEVHPETDPTSPWYKKRLDMKIGFRVEDQFFTMLVESARFRPIDL